MKVTPRLLLCWMTIFLLTTANYSKAQQTSNVPAYFKQVDQTLWIVKDLNNVVDKWRQLGFNQVKRLGVVEATSKKNGNIKLDVAQANLAGAIITWIQPQETGSVFAKFNASYGDGAMSLVYHLNDAAAMQQEIERLKQNGIDQLDAVAINTPAGPVNYVLMNTGKEGKYILGFTYGDVDKQVTADLTNENKFAMRQNQYAFVAKNPEPISDYWQKTGMPPLTMAKPDIGDKMYHNTAANYDLKQGWQKQGKVPYEWCFSLRAPNVYIDHLKQHGEGFHHLGFAVKDMDAVIKDYESKGFHFSMSGSWGEKGKPGSGRFAYVDLEDAGGVTMELLWNYGD
jgi:hypothetical protein